MLQNHALTTIAFQRLDFVLTSLVVRILTEACKLFQKIYNSVDMSTGNAPGCGMVHSNLFGRL